MGAVQQRTGAADAARQHACRTTTRTLLIAALAREGVQRRAWPLRARTRLIVRDGNPLLTPVAGDGSFFVQDEASQLVAALRRRTARRADPRRLRVAGRQDHGDGRGDGGPTA